MTSATFKLPYPQDLICSVICEEISMDSLPPDFEESLEYVLENLMNQSESFMLVLRYLHKMTYREIGNYFGLPAHSARQIVDRALRRLRHPARFNCLMNGISHMDPLPRPRANCPPLGMAPKDTPPPDLGLSVKRRKHRQLLLPPSVDGHPYPPLTLDGNEVRPGARMKVLLVDGWRNVTLDVRPDVTGPARWCIPTPTYNKINPIGLFVEM